MIFGGEAEGVFEVEVTGGDGRVVDGTGDGAEGSVIIVCRDAIARFEVNQFRDVLVPVKGVEEFVVARGRKHKQWTCGEGFGWVQAKRTRSQLFSNRYSYFRLNLFILISFMRFKRSCSRNQRFLRFLHIVFGSSTITRGFFFFHLNASIKS